MCLRFGIKFLMFIVFFLVSVFSFAGERYKVESITTQGQTVDVTRQDCYKDSYIEINGSIATVSLSYVEGSSCKVATGNSKMQSQGNGRYILLANDGSKHAELIINNGKAKYIQDTGILFIFSKVGGTTTTSKSTTKSGQSKSVATKPGRGIFVGTDFSGYDDGIYLRDDGTFSYSLGKDWKTNVDGTYVISGKDIITTDKKNGEKNTYTYDGNPATTGAIYAPGSHYLFKAVIPKNKIPDGVYSFYVGFVNGNATTGVYGSGSRGYIKFEGNRFIESSSSFSSVSSASVGGGSASSSRESGTYTINNGDLTLKYDDGTIVKHSFFYVLKSNGTVSMVVLDGDIYYNE